MNLTCHACVRACVRACVHACARTCMRACVCVYVFYLYVCMYVCLCSCDVVATLYTCFMSHTLPPLTTSPDKHKPVSVEVTKQREEEIEEEEDEESEDCEHTKMCDIVKYTHTHTHMREVYYSQCVEGEMIH